ncbi:MAG: CvpA family protein [Candidatus Aminicenantes bacterium]|nr:CvpA family protein [Candidatus Aminicenantes bacterium]
MNWLDIVLIVAIIGTTIWGLIKGFIRQLMGITAVVAGLILAALYYRGVADVLGAIIRNPLLANFLGFMVIFIATLVAGGLLGHLLTKAMKGPFALANHALGGVFGFIKAVLICGILVFALLVFDLARDTLRESWVARTTFAVTKAVVNLIPQDLRAKFNSSYEEIRKSGGSRGQKI